MFKIDFLCSLIFSVITKTFEEYEYDDYDYDYDDSCRTVDGPKPNQPCIFPFTFNGSSVDTCITGRRRTKPWCSTKKNYVKGEWGFCGDTCPKEGRHEKLFSS